MSHIIWKTLKPITAFQAQCSFKWAVLTPRARIAHMHTGLPNIITTPSPSNTSTYAYISTCQNIFYNLALEEWIYNNVNFSDKRLLILWRNDPCVVIGRHQNPWVECRIHRALQEGLHIARRQSGGGTVYHDRGNLNCTFFTSKKKYNRKENLELAAKALRERWGFDVSVSERDDMILENKYKISGTAAKLGRHISYHHFTLLFDVDKSKLESSLKSDLMGVRSRATESVRSTVKNLCELESELTYENLTDVIAREYLHRYSSSQMAAEYVDPTREKNFPGIDNMYAVLKSWDWVYGKTPKFSVHRTFDATNDLDPVSKLELDLEINKGHIEEVNIRIIGKESEDLCKGISGALCGERFWPSDIAMALAGLGISGLDVNLYRWVCQCIDDVFR